MRLLIAFVAVWVIYNMQLRLYKKYWEYGLEVDLKFSKNIVSFGEKVELIEVIENNKPLPLPILNVKFATSRSFIFDEEENANVSDRYYRNDIFSILGYQKIERRLEFVTSARGVSRINELQVSTRDLFLKHPFADIMDNQTEIIVLPKRIPLENYVWIHNQLMGDYETVRWDNPDPFVFRGIRPYQSFDTMGSINWKATAKVGDLMVNQYQPTTESEAKIYLNLRPYMKSQADFLAEHAISIVSTIASEYISHGINVSFYTNGWDLDVDMAEPENTEKHNDITNDDKRTGAAITLNPHLDMGGGREHLKTLDVMLARIDISKKASDMMRILEEGFANAKDNTTHILVSTYRDDALYDFFEKHIGNTVFYWIVPEREGNIVDLRYNGMYRWDV